LEDYVEAETPKEGARGCFDVDPPSSRRDAGFYRVCAVAAASSAADGKLDATQGGPAALWFVELPIMDNFRVERSGRENRAVSVNRRVRGGVENFNEAEEMERAGIFGLRGVIAFGISCDCVVHAGVLER